MLNYDFHSSFSPPEFERFAGDILEVREGKPFERFGAGADGGIDLRSDTDQKIIGQVKRYQSPNALLQTLRAKELDKVRELNPDRYLLVVSTSLAPRHVDAIFDLFSPYIKSKQDILDREGLNRLLGLAKYHEVEKRHYKLWLTSSNVLKNLLREELHRGMLNDCRDELERMRDELPLYVQTPSFWELLKSMDANDFVVISGSPGIGKTMLGRALVAYHLEKLSFDEMVYVQGSIENAQALYIEEKSQIFFFDDFWGSVFAKNPNDRNEDKRLFNFLEKIQRHPNKKAVLTTREYVFQQGASRRNFPELARFLAQRKSVITPEGYTARHRARILLNHLYFSDLSDDFFSTFVWGKEYLRIVDHRNYTPRLIKSFIRDFRHTEKSSFEFGTAFSDFLANPYNFYSDVFEKQTDTAKLLLLIVFISNEPILYSDLLKTIKRSMGPAMASGMNVELASLKDALSSLEKTFVVTSNAYSDADEDLRVGFVNPSIKDFLLRYLREHIDVYGDVLIKGACFFNQIDFAFDTRPDAEIVDDDSEDPLFGKAIVLKGDLRILLKDKLLSEFDSLSYSTFETGWMDRYTRYTPSEDTAVWKLIRLQALFDLASNLDVRGFVLGRHSNLTDALLRPDSAEPLCREAMMNYPQLTKSILSECECDFKGIVASFYKAITLTSEFRALHWLGELFPDEYHRFVAENTREIKRKVVVVILDEADYLAYEDDETAFAKLVDQDVPEVLPLYGMKSTKAFREQLYELAGEIPPWHLPKRAQKGKLVYSHDDDEDVDEESVGRDFESLLSASYLDNDLSDDEIDTLLSSANMPDLQRSALHARLNTIPSSAYSHVLHDRAVLTVAVDAACNSAIDLSKAASHGDFLLHLVHYCIVENLKQFKEDLSASSLLARFEHVAYSFNFEREKCCFREVERQLSGSGFADSLTVDDFVELCSPFLTSFRGHVVLVSEFIGKCAAARHVHRLESTSRTEFFENTLPKAGENQCLVTEGWWHALAYFDEEGLFKKVAEPVIRQTLNDVDLFQNKNSFLEYVRYQKLDIILEKVSGDSTYEPREIGGCRPILNDVTELVEAKISNWELADWFAHKLKSGSESERDELLSVFQPDHRRNENERLRIDFGSWKPRRTEDGIIESIGLDNRFQDKLDQFRHRLSEMLESQSLLIVDGVSSGL